MIARILLVLVFLLGVDNKGLKEGFTWTRITYAISQPFASNYSRKLGFFPGTLEGESGPESSKNYYVFENNIPMGANKWGNKLFVMVPRRRLGVISTLNFVWLNGTQRHNVPLIPYPSLELNQLNTGRDGPHLVSVYRVAVDSCDRLWMVDTGILELPGNRTQIQPSALLVIDLNTNRIIRRYVFKDAHLTPASTLANVFIDITGSCSDAFAYIPDLSSYGIIVYSFAENDAWRMSHNYFHLEPLAGEFNIGGHRFQWNDGVFSLGLSNVAQDGYRTVFFHSMAGTHLYSVSSRVLRSRSLATRSYHGNDFKIVADRGIGSQASASDLHQPTGILFLGLVNQNALGCWNVRKTTELINFDVVHQDDAKFIYPCDVKVSQDDLIVLSNGMPIFLYGRLNYDQINFRVWITPIQEIVSGSACVEAKRASAGNYGPFYG